MRSIIVTLGILLYSPQTSIPHKHRSEQSLYPPAIMSKEEFLLQLAAIVAAHESCEKFEDNYQYYHGYISATGIVPLDEPLFIKLLAESRQEISHGKEVVCHEIKEIDTFTKDLSPNLAPLFKSNNN